MAIDLHPNLWFELSTTGQITGSHHEEACLERIGSGQGQKYMRYTSGSQEASSISFPKEFPFGKSRNKTLPLTGQIKISKVWNMSVKQDVTFSCWGEYSVNPEHSIVQSQLLSHFNFLSWLPVITCFNFSVSCLWGLYFSFYFPHP